MLWIRCRIADNKFKDIPKELFYDGWQTERDNYDNTPLMLWIMKC